MISAGPLTFITWIIMMCESCCSSSRKFISNSKNPIGIVPYLTKLNCTTPGLSMHCHCYHYETRTRHITETDSNGHTHTRTETYQELVTTYRGREDFDFNRWANTSCVIPGMKMGMTKVYVELGYCFGDDYSRNMFDRQYHDFQQRNRYRDVHFEHWTSYNVAGYEREQLCITRNDWKPCFLGVPMFLLYSSLCLSFVYRRWMDSLCDEVKYTVHKTIYLDPSVPRTIVFMGPTSNTPNHPSPNALQAQMAPNPLAAAMQQQIAMQMASQKLMQQAQQQVASAPPAPPGTTTAPGMPPLDIHMPMPMPMPMGGMATQVMPVGPAPATTSGVPPGMMPGPSYVPPAQTTQPGMVTL